MRWAIGVVLVSACFNPQFNKPACGLGDACPDGLRCVAGFCERPRAGEPPGPPDAQTSDSPALDASTGTDASLCFDGFTRVCLQVLPSSPLVVAAAMTIDTASGCAETTMGTAAGICVVAATTIEIRPGVIVHATGPRPLILLATTSIVVSGEIDAASHRGGTTGPGANLPGCPVGTAPATLGGGSGGGYGGTFGTVGGDGGNSIGRGARGIAPAIPVMPTMLRGGCPGIAGAGPNPGAGGAGGGAVELISPRITVSGLVNASGAGAGGGLNSDSGGGGGGSGGMIVLAATTRMVNGSLMAQGGGGGGGSGDAVAGMPGNDPVVAGDAALPGDGAHAAAGAGGNGGFGAITIDAGDAQDGNTIGGGGGGGGAGIIIQR